MFNRMYNSLDFKKIMDKIGSQAFDDMYVPNSNDPLILHFRIMSKNKSICKKMADILYDSLEKKGKLLGKSYSYENGKTNLGATHLKDLVGKIIIAVDHSNPIYSGTPLEEYINITSNSVYMRALRENDVIYTHDMEELINFNKTGMTIVFPNLSASNSNIQAQTCMTVYGCQMPAMSFQNYDQNMQWYNDYFVNTGGGHAFVLKPDNLRYIPVTVPKPPPPSCKCNIEKSKD